MLQKFLDKTFTAALVIIFIAFIGFILFLLNKTITGHGLDYYFSGFGYKLSYLGALILIAVIPLLVTLAWLINWIIGRDERDFKKKYLTNKVSNKKRSE